MDTLPVIFFWGSIVLSIFLSMIGIIWQKEWPLWSTAASVLPLSFYFSYTPFGFASFLLPIFHILAALVVKRAKLLAVILILPFLTLVTWIGVNLFDNILLTR